MAMPSSNRTSGADKELFSPPLLDTISANNRIVLNMTAHRVRRNRCLLRCKSAVSTQSPISPPMARRYPTSPRCVFPPGVLDLRMRESDNMELGSYISINAEIITAINCLDLQLLQPRRSSLSLHFIPNQPIRRLLKLRLQNIRLLARHVHAAR